MPSTRLAPDQLWPLPSDHHRVTVEVVLDFLLRFPNVALRQNRILHSVNLRRSWDTSSQSMMRLSAHCPDEVVVRRISRQRSAAAEHPAPACGPQRETS